MQNNIKIPAGWNDYERRRIKSMNAIQDIWNTPEIHDFHLDRPASTAPYTINESISSQHMNSSRLQTITHPTLTATQMSNSQSIHPQASMAQINPVQSLRKPSLSSVPGQSMHVYPQSQTILPVQPDFQSQSMMHAQYQSSEYKYSRVNLLSINIRTLNTLCKSAQVSKTIARKSQQCAKHNQ